MTQPPQQPGQWWQPGNPQQPENTGSWQPEHTGPWQPDANQQQQQPQWGQQPQPWQQQAAPQPDQWQQQQQPYPAGYPQTPGQQPQYGGGFQPTPASQYGGLGAFGEGEKKARTSKKKPLLIGGIVVVVLAAGVATAWFSGLFSGDVLDNGSVQAGVTTVLKDSYGEQDVQNAQCPEDQEIKTGHTFECSVSVAGQPKKVSIRVLNDKPEFEVGAPK